MRVVETKVYTYDELDDEAKEKAREWFAGLAFSDSNDWDCVFEMAVTAGALLGIDIDTRRGSRSEPAIYFSGFWSQGDGACFEGSYKYRKGCLKLIKDEFPNAEELHRIAKALTAVQRRNFYKLEAVMQHRGRYNHSGCMSVSVEHSEDRYRDIGDAEDDITQLMRDFADWIYDSLEKEHDYLTSEEAVVEGILCNEYEFTENGRLA